jgi:hypothetical protein
MANAITALNPELWKSMTQDFLNNSLVSMAVANTKCEAYLNSGDKVHFPYLADVRIQSYAQGTDLTVDALAATDDSLTVDQSKAVVFAMDPVQEKQALADYGNQMAYQASYVLRNEIDQNVIQSGVSNVNNTVTGGTLTSSTIISKMTDVYAQLQRNNATDGEVFAILDPDRAALLSQTFIANGFQIGDNTLRNGFSGRAVGFDVYTSNNLKYSVTLTVDTQPANTDTLTIAGITWTCVTDGTAANAGEIAIGADLADFKTILPLALNGGGTPGASAYIDIATADRRVYQNAQLTAASAFVGNDLTITAYGKMSPSETFTTATNIFGTETTNMLFGRKGAVSLAIQMQPELYIRPEPKQLANNYISHTLYGYATFTRDKKRLVALSANA